MGTINRFKDVFVRLKLKRKSYARRVSFIALVSTLLVSFQNCSQGKFDVDEAKMVSASKSDTNTASGSGSSGIGGVPTAPPPDQTPVAPVQASEAEIMAEVARRTRCKSAIKTPIFVNASDYTNRILNVKSGLAAGSGDLDLPNNPISATVDSSHGVDSTRYQMGDNCIFRTRVIVAATSGNGRDPSLDTGIDSNGDQLVLANENGKRAIDYMGRTLQTRVNNNNANNDDYVAGSDTLGINFRIRQPQNPGDLRETRCVQGSIYYSVRIEVETQGLNTSKAGYPDNRIRIGDAASSSASQYVKVEVENACWKEVNFAKVLMAASPTSAPAANSLLGTATAIDGEWAVSISNSEGGTGYIYIFRKVSGNWTFFQKLKGNNGNGTRLTGLALSGSLLAVASSGDGLGYPGRAFLYSLNGSLLTTPFRTLDSPVGAGAKFGSSIAVGGSSIAIGDSATSGRAYLYNLSGDYLVEQTAASINSGILGFGSKMVYQNGRLIVGAFSGNDDYAGSVHVFDVGGGSFGSPIHKYAPTGTQGITSKGNFGSSIAFDGSALLVGAYENAITGLVAGAIVYYADYTSSAAPKVIQGSVENERYGTAVAIIGDSIYIGSRGGTGSPGTVSRYLKSSFASATYNSKVFTHNSHDADNGEGFSYSMSILNGASVPTLLISAQTKDFTISASESRSKGGGLYLYEVK